MERHKVFISYHHANDENYKIRFERLFSVQLDAFISRSVQVGDINPDISDETIRQKIRDEYLRDSTVTVVLIGSETFKRKHVDWEISSTLRDTEFNPRGGLLGILLPTFSSYPNVNLNLIPQRLADNVSNGYAKIIPWTDNVNLLKAEIHLAFIKRRSVIPDNSAPLFKNNR